MEYIIYVLKPITIMMKLSDIKNDIVEITHLGQKIDRFFCAYEESKGCMTNVRGHFWEFERLTNYIQDNCECKDGYLPIYRLIFYTDTCVHSFVANHLYDPEKDASMDSYLHVNVPLIDKDLNFLLPSNL